MMARAELDPISLRCVLNLVSDPSNEVALAALVIGADELATEINDSLSSGGQGNRTCRINQTRFLSLFLMETILERRWKFYSLRKDWRKLCSFQQN